MVRILVVDNYDSFVYNITQYMSELGANVVVLRNDVLGLEERIEDFDGIIISPGPGHPRESKGSLKIVANSGIALPLLGICLGHQVIAYLHGAEIVKGKLPVHGKLSEIRHFGSSIFDGIPRSFKATRYHSLVVDPDTLPDSLQVIAVSEAQEIMALEVLDRPMFGLQFHPESILTSFGRQIFSNFLRMCRK
ncbi:MAG: aminodeoxychorismate/anthranilate synthase component II [Methanomassiliicoccales archaeon]